MIRFFSIASLSFIFSACNNNIIVEEKIEFANNEWITGDLKSITIESPDTTDAYALDIEVNHGSDYAFQNLYIRTSTTFPSGKKVSSVTSLELINKDGTWAGDCSGKICTVTLPLQPVFRFPELGAYLLSIEPYMREDTVRSIKSIEVRCTRK